MSDPERPLPPDPTKQPLDYAPSDLRIPAPSHPYTPVIRGMAIAWVVAAMFSGVASDRILIPVRKKVAITVAGVVIAAVMAHDADSPRRRGCLIAFLLTALWIASVMWFWN